MEKEATKLSWSVILFSFESLLFLSLYYIHTSYLHTSSNQLYDSTINTNDLTNLITLFSFSHCFQSKVMFTNSITFAIKIMFAISILTNNIPEDD